MILFAADLPPHSPASPWVATAFLLLLLGAVGWRLIRLSRRAAQASRPAPPALAPAPGRAETEVPLLVLLAAAADAALDQPHRVVRIQPAAERAMLAWSIEGRRQIFSSHQPR